jgi:UDP-glucose 4-epimerase
MAEHLAGAGHSVRVLDARLPAPSERRPAGVEYLEGNLLNSSDLDAALSPGADIVLHFVSTTVPASSVDNVPVEVETNVLATVRLLDAMLRHGIRRLGFPSSGGTVYAETGTPHREDEVCQPTCPYGLGKLLIEELLRFYGERRGLEYQIWRISNPYGDRTRRHRMQGVVDAFLHRVRDGELIQLWGDGRAARDFIFIDDLALALELSLLKGTWNQTYNVGTGYAASVMEVLQIIEQVVGRSLRVERFSTYTGPARSVLDPSKLKESTGWEPSFDLQAGIQLAWKRLSQGTAETPNR